MLTFVRHAPSWDERGGPAHARPDARYSDASFRFQEATHLELRIETFNLFNWTNYGFPGGSASNLNTFGRISSTLGDPREIQLAIKFYF